MKIYNYLLPVILICLILASCSTVNIASNKQEGYNKHPKKIYILVTCSKNTNIFCTGLVNGLKNKFSERGIQSESYVHDPLSLETEQNLDKKASDYAPEAILKIQQIITGDGRGTFELTLIDIATKKNVWKSELEISADTYTSIEDTGVINKGLKSLLEKLIQDNII